MEIMANLVASQREAMERDPQFQSSKLPEPEECYLKEESSGSPRLLPHHVLSNSFEGVARFTESSY